jgi:cell division protein FtsZ
MLPFSFEGSQRMSLAKETLNNLKSNFDSIIVIPNDKLLKNTNEEKKINEAFSTSNEILLNMVKSTMELLNMPSLVNLNFSDLETVLREGGFTFFGQGISELNGIDSLVKSLDNKFYNIATVKGSQKVLINIKCGKNLKLIEINDMMIELKKNFDENTKFILGINNDCDNNEIKTSIIITGIPELNFNETEEQKPLIESKNNFNSMKDYFGTSLKYFEYSKYVEMTKEFIKKNW